jgi:hypothetical protein
MLAYMQELDLDSSEARECQLLLLRNVSNIMRTAFGTLLLEPHRLEASAGVTILGKGQRFDLADYLISLIKKSATHLDAMQLQRRFARSSPRPGAPPTSLQQLLASLAQGGNVGGVPIADFIDTVSLNGPGALTVPLSSMHLLNTELSLLEWYLQHVGVNDNVLKQFVFQHVCLPASSLYILLALSPSPLQALHRLAHFHGFAEASMERLVFSVLLVSLPHAASSASVSVN